MNFKHGRKSQETRGTENGSLHTTNYGLCTARGFTLIEIMVALAIFAIVMTIAAGSLLTIVNANRKSQSLQSVMNNLAFAMENMVRNMRTGTAYHCGSSGNLETPQNCSGGDDFLALEAVGGSPGSSSDQVVYRLNGARIEKSENGGASFLPITAPEIEVTNLSFYVEGAALGDGEQPKIIMTIAGEAGASARTRTDFSLQTTISQRILDI